MGSSLDSIYGRGRAVTNYTAGRAFEYQVRDDLEADGYQVIRAAGSKGAADLIAIKPGQILLVQVKRLNGTIPPADRVKLTDLARMCDGLPLVAHKPVPRGGIKYRLLTGTGVADWVAWVADFTTNGDPA
jgi:Holliday junction resolvase